MKTSILNMLLSFNGDTGLFIERLHHVSYPLLCGKSAADSMLQFRKTLPLESGWTWAFVGMGKPSLQSIAKVCDASGAVVCSPEIKADAIAFARKAGEFDLAAFLEGAK
jgi:hypothetical protein